LQAISHSTLIGVAINFVGLDPIKALVWSAVINGVVSAPLMAIIMLMAMRRGVMGFTGAAAGAASHGMAVHGDDDRRSGVNVCDLVSLSAASSPQSNLRRRSPSRRATRLANRRGFPTPIGAPRSDANGLSGGSL
jgi:Mn2+/Fe2+ NRAMP family transporter